MFELFKEGIFALENYGATYQDLNSVIFYCIGLIPISIYCFKFNHPRYNRITCIGIQLIRISLFSLFFYTYIRYGFTNLFIKYNSLVLIMYTLIGYYYWVQEELLYKFKVKVRKLFKYVFYIGTLIEFFYLSYRSFLGIV